MQVANDVDSGAVVHTDRQESENIAAAPRRFSPQTRKVLHSFYYHYIEVQHRTLLYEKYKQWLKQSIDCWEA